jgi:hypothetical protein
MRYRPDDPNVMDFLLVSLFLEERPGDTSGSPGHGPARLVGEMPSAHVRERWPGCSPAREAMVRFRGLRR